MPIKYWPLFTGWLYLEVVHSIGLSAVAKVKLRLDYTSWETDTVFDKISFGRTLPFADRRFDSFTCHSFPVPFVCFEDLKTVLIKFRFEEHDTLQTGNLILLRIIFNIHFLSPFVCFEDLNNKWDKWEITVLRLTLAHVSSGNDTAVHFIYLPQVWTEYNQWKYSQYMCNNIWRI